MLTKAQRYDYHDIDPLESTLIRAAHHTWRLMRLERRQNGGYLPEGHPSWLAIETMMEAKRVYREVLKQRRAVKSAAMKERFANHARI